MRNHPLFSKEFPCGVARSLLSGFIVLLAAGSLVAADTNGEFDLYVDSRRGDDANPGTRDRPLKNLPTGVNDGARIGLARGSFWRASSPENRRGAWDLSGRRMVIGAYGEGEKPILAGYRPLDKERASKVGGYKNLYLFIAEDRTESRLAYPGVYVGDETYPIEGALFRVGVGQTQKELMGLAKDTEAEALAWVDENPGWFYYTFEKGEHRYYLHSSRHPREDPRRIEFKFEGMVLNIGDDSEIRGIRLVGSAWRNGVVAQNRNTRRLWEDVVFQDGAYHTMLAGTGKAWIDCVSVGSPNGPASLFHLNGPSQGSPGAVYVRTRALGPGIIEGAPGIGASAYYDHTSQKPNIIMLDVESQGMRGFLNYTNRSVDEGGALIISGARINDKAGTGQRRGLPPALPYGTFGGGIGPNRTMLVENVTAYLGGLDGIVVGGEEKEYVVRNSIFVFRQAERVGALFQISEQVNARFEHCTFIIDTYGANLYQPNLVTGPVKFGSVYTFEAARGNLHFEKCLFVLEKPNINYAMHFPYATRTFKITANDCVFSPGFTNLPTDGGNLESADIFAAVRSWRDGDFTLSKTSPAHQLDAGARAGREPRFRARAEAMVRDILGYLP